jgi:hypothetical protein
MSILYTRVSDEFDADRIQGVLFCCEDINDTYGFTEQGYDTADYDSVPTVYEVVPTIDDFADEKQAIAAARSAGFVIFDTHEDIDRAREQGKFKGSWAEGNAVCLEETTINQLLENADFRKAVEEAGIMGIRDFVVVGNCQPMMTLLWVPGTAELRGPIPVEPVDEDNLQIVRLASPKSVSAPSP